MEELKNKECIKVMWLPNQKEFLFTMKFETVLPIESFLYLYISQYINMEKWQNEYGYKYNDWLNNDDNSIFDIKNPVNLGMVKSLIELNMVLKFEKLFYWFDIDRTYNDDFIWEYCPVSNKKLVALGGEFSKRNSLISPDYPLVFPLE